jgi:hypothetical protein
MNQLIAQRNEMSTRLLKMCASDSEITLPNQPNSMNTSVANPSATLIPPRPYPLNQNAAPMPMSSSATAPTIGQCDGCGM